MITTLVPKVISAEIDISNMTPTFSIDMEVIKGMGVRITGGINDSPIQTSVHKKNTPYRSSIYIAPFATFHGAGRVVSKHCFEPAYCADVDSIMIDYTNKDTLASSILNSKILDFQDLGYGTDGFTTIRRFKKYTQYYTTHVYLDSIVVELYSIKNKSGKRTDLESELYYIHKDSKTGEWEFEHKTPKDNNREDDREWPFCVFGTR